MLKMKKAAKDHPRACGEKVVDVFREHRIPGSPPRMRGKGMADTPKIFGARITPAHAGKRHTAL